ncbi:MAG: hypothetical protein ABIP75_19635, partial [Pyrinomonadaceae bacterium]
MRSIQMTVAVTTVVEKETRSSSTMSSKFRDIIIVLAAIIVLAGPAVVRGQGTRGDRPIPTTTIVTATPAPTPEPVQLSKPGQNAEIPGLLKVGGGRMEVVDSPIG